MEGTSVNRGELVDDCALLEFQGTEYDLKVGEVWRLSRGDYYAVVDGVNYAIDTEKSTPDVCWQIAIGTNGQPVLFMFAAENNQSAAQS